MLFSELEVLDDFDVFDVVCDVYDVSFRFVFPNVGVLRVGI